MKIYSMIAGIFAIHLSIFGDQATTPNVTTGTTVQQEVSERMARDFDFIQNSFDAKYGPALWKHQILSWDLNAQINLAQNALLNNPNPTLINYWRTLKSFIRSTNDYHVSATFFSTESAHLPFSIAGVNGVYYISSVENPSQSPILVGDQVLSFGGIPVAQAIDELKQVDFNNKNLTDEHLAQLFLTQRVGSAGFIVPSGPIVITVKSSTGAIKSFQYTWNYSPQTITTPALSALENAYTANLYDLLDKNDSSSACLRHRLSNRNMINPLFYHLKGLKADNTITTHPHFIHSQTALSDVNAMAAPQSFIPPLGPILWQSAPQSPYYAYIFRSPSGKNVGYIRIATYDNNGSTVPAFAQLISFLNANTVALVIDQVNNPGGSLFYMYTLASYLSTTPLIPPKHHLRLTQEDIVSSMQVITQLKAIQNDAQAQALIGPSMNGYPVTYKLAQSMIAYHQFMINQWNQSNLFTDATFLEGISTIQPSVGAYNSSKPIILVINSLDFSCGDFFPAIMQDNKRAVLFGSPTAGAGGYIDQLNYYNPFGVAHIQYTASIAARLNNQPIETLGITPDIRYTLTSQDLQTNFTPYTKALLNAVETVLKGTAGSVVR